MDPIFSFTFAIVSGIAVGFATVWLAKKAGLQPAQLTLVNTLSQTVSALQAQVLILKTEVEAAQTLVGSLQAHVERLETLVLELTQENSDLRTKAGIAPRRKTT